MSDKEIKPYTKYPYRKSKLIWIFLSLISFGGTFVLCGLTAHKVFALLQQNNFDFDLIQASSLYWIGTLLSLTLSLVILAITLNSKKAKQHIIISPVSITLPQYSVKRKMLKEIPFENITDIFLEGKAKKRNVQIKTKNCSLKIHQRMLYKQSTFKELIDQLREYAPFQF